MFRLLSRGKSSSQAAFEDSINNKCIAGWSMLITDPCSPEMLSCSSTRDLAIYLNALFHLHAPSPC